MGFLLGIVIGGSAIAIIAAVLHTFPTIDPKFSWLPVAIPILAAAFASWLTNFYNVKREERSKQNEFERSRIALLHELSSRVGQCLFDFHSPWIAYASKENEAVRQLQEVHKFMPPSTVIYPTAGATLARMRPQTARSIIHFYDALERWGREVKDADYSAKSALMDDGSRVILSSDLRRMSRRLGDTLEPGLFALRALCDEIGVSANKILQEHFDAYYNRCVESDPRLKFKDNIRPLELLAAFSALAVKLKNNEMNFSPLGVFWLEGYALAGKDS